MHLLHAMGRYRVQFIAALVLVLAVVSLAAGCSTHAATSPNYSPIWMPQGGLLCAAYKHASSIRFEVVEGGGVLTFVAKPDALDALRRALMDVAPDIDNLALQLSHEHKEWPADNEWSLKKKPAQIKAHGGGSTGKTVVPLRRPTHSSGEQYAVPARPVTTTILSGDNEVQLRIVATSPDYIADLRQVLQRHVQLVTMGRCDWRREHH